MPVTDANVMSGTLTGYFKAFANDNDPVAADAVDWTGWTSLGHFIDGAAVNWGVISEWFESKVDDLYSILDKKLVALDVQITVPIAESAAVLLATFIPGAKHTVGSAGVNATKLEFGEAAESKFSIGFEGIGPGFANVLFLSKTVPISMDPIPHHKRTNREFNVTFQCLYDDNEATNAKLGTFYELLQ